MPLLRTSATPTRIFPLVAVLKMTSGSDENRLPVVWAGWYCNAPAESWTGFHTMMSLRPSSLKSATMIGITGPRPLRYPSG